MLFDQQVAEQQRGQSGPDRGGGGRHGPSLCPHIPNQERRLSSRNLEMN